MPNASRFSPLRVLVVDDCPDTTDTLALLLEMWGHAVWVAHDGPTALEIARDCRPDVLLSDIALPGLSGWELARQMRALAGLSKALLVAVTGYAHQDDVTGSGQAGFNLHLTKPVDPEQLQQLLLAHAAEMAGPVGEFAPSPTLAVSSSS
jgi:CheY-like chemotaxis protein